MSRKGGIRFDFIGIITRNVLLRVSCFGEVSHRMCSYVVRVLCFGEVSHKMCSYVVRVS